MTKTAFSRTNPVIRLSADPKTAEFMPTSRKKQLFLRSFIAWLSHPDQMDWAQQSRRHWLHLVHVLRLEALAVTQVEQPVVRQSSAGHVIERKIADLDPDLVMAAPQQAGDVNSIGGTPDRSGALLINIDHGGFANRRVNPGLHTRPELLRQS